MNKLFTANKYVPVVFALTAFTVAGTAPVFAQSSGTWGASISTRNIRPFVHEQSINHRGYNSYGRVTDYSAIVSSSLGPADRFGEASQR
jgi:hypothetical protein